MSDSSTAVACRSCYTPHSVPLVLGRRMRLRCSRCGASFQIGTSSSWRYWAISCAAGALLLWPFAVFVPMLEKVQRGPDDTYSVWEGATIFFRGEPSVPAFVAGVVVFTLAIVYTPFKNLSTIWFAARGVVSRRAPCTGKEWLRSVPRKIAHFVNHHFAAMSMLEVCILGFSVMAFFDKSPFRLILGPGLVAFVALFVMTVFSKLAYHFSHIWEVENLEDSCVSRN